MPHKDISSRRATNRRHYERNKAAVIKRNAEFKLAARAKWAEFKATLACTKCGENHPATLDFHHVVQSKDNVKVYKLTADGAYKKALKEIEKCVVLCSNCHRKEHWYEREEKKKGAEAPQD
jgi:5-methylcytosine-specific restriction endonuclease McrA